MKFVTIRELRNRPGRIWDELRGDDLVLTADGKPVGILVGVEEEDLEASLGALRARPRHAGDVATAPAGPPPAALATSRRVRWQPRCAPSGGAGRLESRPRHQRPGVGLLNPHGPPGRILDLVLAGKLRLLLDDRVVDEYREVLLRPRFDFDPADVAAFDELPRS